MVRWGYLRNAKEKASKGFVEMNRQVKCLIVVRPNGYS